jgi:hypothetical protein
VSSSLNWLCFQVWGIKPASAKDTNRTRERAKQSLTSILTGVQRENDRRERIRERKKERERIRERKKERKRGERMNMVAGGDVDT